MFHPVYGWTLGARSEVQVRVCSWTLEVGTKHLRVSCSLPRSLLLLTMSYHHRCYLFPTHIWWVCVRVRERERSTKFCFTGAVGVVDYVNVEWLVGDEVYGVGSGNSNVPRRVWRLLVVLLNEYCIVALVAMLMQCGSVGVFRLIWLALCGNSGNSFVAFCSTTDFVSHLKLIIFALRLSMETRSRLWSILDWRISWQQKLLL